MDISHRSKWQGKWLKLLAATGLVASAIGYGVVKAADTYGVSQQFSPNVVLSTAPLNKSTLQVTVYNLTNGDMPNLNLTDVLGAGISVAATPNAVNSANCPGVSIAGSGQNVTISGASGIASGKSCVFSIDVEASTPGTFNADIAAGSPFTSSNTVPVAANAQLVVSNQTFVSPTLSHGRWEPTIYPGGVDHLVVDISNPNAAALPGGTFSFTIPAGTTLVGTPAYNHPTYNGSNPNTGCNGTVTVSGSTVTVTNLTMPPMVGGVAGYCRLDYQLTSTVVGTYTVSSTAGAFSAVGGTISNANASSTNFQVIPKPTLSLVKTFSRPVAPAVNWTIGQHPMVTLTVYNQTDDPWTTVKVADTMPAGLAVNTAVPSTGTCSAAGTLTAATASFVIPSVAANSSCTIVFETTVTSVPTDGVAENIIPANTMTRDPIRGDAGQVNNNSGSDKLAIVPVAPGGPNLDTISKEFQSVIGAGLGNTGVIDGIAGGRVRLLFTVTKTLPGGLDYPLSNIKIEDDWSVSAPHILTNVAPGSVMPAGEIYANNCGVDAAVNVINPQKLVLSGLAIPLGRTYCQVGVFLNVDPALVAPDPLNGVLETNTATACLDATNSPANCSVVGKTSNQPTIELFSAQPLQVEKTANGAKTLTLALTQQFNYNFTIKNPSSVAATNVTMVDTLPAGVRFASPLTVTALSCVNATVGTAPTAAGSTLTWVIPAMNGFDAAGTAASCSVSVLAEADPAVAVPGTPYTNTVEIGKVTASEPNRANTLSSQALVTFRTAPEGLVLTKAFANPVVFKDNGDATLDTNLFGSGFDEATMLQFTLFNSSTTTGFTNVAFTDSLPAGVRVRNPATPVTTGTTCVGAVIDASVVGKVTVTVPTLAATVNCKVMVQVLGTVVGSYTNTIPAKSVTTNEGATNTVPTSADLTVVATAPGISVYKDVTAVNSAASLHGTQVNPGDQLTYRLVLKNNNYPAAALKDYAPLVTDVLPAGVEFVSADNGGTASGQTVTWNFSGSSVVLDRNGTFPLNVTVKVKLDATGTLANVAKLGTSSSDCATPYAGGSCLATPPVAACVMPANPLAPTAAEIANPAICQPVAVKVAAVKHTLTKDVFAAGTTTPSLNTKLVAAGDKLTYVLTLKNTGEGALSVKDFVKTVTDKVPTGTTYVAGSASVGGTFAAGVVTWDLTADASTLAKDATRTFSFDVTVDDTAVGPLTNVGKTSTETSNTVTNPVAVPSASLVKDVFKSSDLNTSINTKTVAAGDELTYTITLKNTGAGVLSVKDFVKTVTDKVPTGTTYVAGSASAGGTFSGGVVTWDLSTAANLAKDATMVFSFKVTVNVDATGTLSNVAKSGAGDSNVVTNPIAVPGQSIVKDVFKTSDLSTSIDTKNVVAGDALTYKITLKNTGAGVLSLKDFVKSVTDTLPKGVTYVAGSADNGGVFTATPAPGVLVWDFTSSSEVLAAGATKVLTFRVTVDASATGVIRNVAVTPGTSSNTVTNPVTASRHTLVKDVFKSSDLTTSINGKNVVAGDELTYTLTLKNEGPGPLSVKDFVRNISDAVPVGVTYVAGSADNGGVFTATPAPGVVNWDLTSSPDVMAPGATKVFSFKVKVDLTASGVISNVARTGSEGSNTVTNPVLPPKHSIVKDVFKTGSTSSIKGTTVAAGDLLTYQITVTNTGTGDLSVKDFVKSVTDTLPAGVTVIRISEGGVGDRTIVWDLSSSARVLKPGESMVFTVDVKVNDDASGSLKNVAKSPTEGSNEVENPVAAPKHVLIKDVRKTGTVASIIGQDVLNRDTLTYVLTIRNTGAGNLVLKTAVQELRDALPAGTVFVSANNGGVYSGGFVIWNLENDNTVLAPGASKEFSFNVVVTEDASMPLVNVAQTPAVSSCPLNDASCIANPPQPVCSMPANAEKLTAAESADPKICKPVVNNVQLNTTLVVEKVADRQQAELGDSLKYTIRVRNSGQARATAVVLRDTLPAGFRYIAGTARLSNNAALAEPEGAPGPALTFHLGNLAPGAEITLTYRVRVGAGAAQGDGINRATACTTQNKILCSNEGRARVKVTGGVFTDEACIAGKVFVDVDGNRLQDAEEVGVPGVRLYMETGTFFITDVEGKYSYCGLSPKSHTIKVDPSTLPRSAELVPSSNRNLGDGNSLYLDVKRGELIRGDFIIGNPTDAVLNQVKARRAQGEVSGPQNERAGAPALVFESRKVTPLTSASPKEGINNTAEQAVPRVRDPQAGVESCAPGACDEAPLRVDPQRVQPALEGSSTSGKQ